jgi:predicted MFS family arabinose efflux permease
MAAKKAPKKKQPKFITLTGIAVQMGITIYGFSYLGKYLDQNYNPTGRAWTISLVLVGVAFSLYNLLRQVNRINDAEDGNK